MGPLKNVKRLDVYVRCGTTPQYSRVKMKWLFYKWVKVLLFSKQATWVSINQTDENSIFLVGILRF